MLSKKTIRQLVEMSRVVFKQCALPNGAIVAARPDLPGYPRDVQSYGFVWIRDAAFVCAAAHRVGVHNVQRPFFRWVAERAERTPDGLLVNTYFPNGVAAGVTMVDSPIAPRDRGLTHTLTLAGQLQPDALGTLLWAIADHGRFVRLTAPERRLMAEVAESLMRLWSGRAFRRPTWDVWETFVADPRRLEIHTYSLAMAIRGLEAADHVLPREPRRQRAIKSLRTAFERTYDARRRTFVRARGRRTSDATPDSSLFGLVFPAQQVAATDPRLSATLARIFRRCRAADGGLVRFPGDRYTGRLRAGRLVFGRAGTWPWLSAWAAFVLAERGELAAAERAFRRAVAPLRLGALPEAISGGAPVGASGLAVAHAFAVFAAERLGVLPRPRAPLLSVP